MIKFLRIMLLALVFTLGCVQQTTPTLPYFKEDLRVQPTSIAQGDNFKLFFTISNPTQSSFIPYIKISYPDQINTNDFPRGRTDTLALSSIPAFGEKAYFITFQSYSTTSSNDYQIDVFLYKEQQGFSPLAQQSIKVRISETVQNTR